MLLIDTFLKTAADYPEQVFCTNSSGETMSYAQAAELSEKIARLIAAKSEGKRPVMVYGHKSPLMLAAFLGCMRSGHPYVPVDCHSVPVERVCNIATQIGEPLLLTSVDMPQADIPATVIDVREPIQAPDAQLACIEGEDVMYILFTSGSTGAPKGVMVTASCVENFSQWARTLGAQRHQGQVFMNQAPLSFDLSVYEWAQVLACGGTFFALEKGAQEHTADMLEALRNSGTGVWVSTPSFADMLLVNKEFNSEMLPKLDTMLFCGETLTNATACKLMDRFPGVHIINSYGPTESTVAVTAVDITREMAEAPDALPVGTPRPGTRMRIVPLDGEGACPEHADTLPSVEAGQAGEIVIEGDTVALGYFGREDLTAKAFGSTQLDGKQVRTYRTGDEGYLDEEGMLHYHGRIDLQIKLNGYRIELGDIEGNLLELESISQAAVIPAYRKGKLVHLVAHVASTSERAEGDFKEGLALKEALKESLPHYMIPKKFVFHDSLPMTPNGKTDRKALAAMN